MNKQEKDKIIHLRKRSKELQSEIDSIVYEALDLLDLPRINPETFDYYKATELEVKSDDVWHYIWNGGIEESGD